MDGVVAGGVALGVTAVASIGTGILALYRRPNWKHALALVASAFVFLPLFFFDKALEDALDAIEKFLGYPGKVYDLFLAYKPEGSPLCTIRRNEALNETGNYEIPDVDDVRQYVDDYRPFIYVIAAVVTGLAMVTVLLARWPAPARLGIGSSVLSATVFSVVFAAFVGLAFAIRQLCDEHASKDELDDQVRWFVDSTVPNDGSRPWVNGLDAFLNECGGEISQALNRTLYPGALEPEFDTLHTALCTDLPASFDGTWAVVGATVFLWLGLSVYYSLQISSKSKQEKLAQIKLGGLIF